MSMNDTMIILFLQIYLRLWIWQSLVYTRMLYFVLLGMQKKIKR